MSIGASCPSFNQTLVVFELSARIAHRIALHLQIAQRKHQIPVSALHVGDRFDRALPKLRVGQRQILPAQSQSAGDCCQTSVRAAAAACN